MTSLILASLAVVLAFVAFGILCWSDRASAYGRFNSWVLRDLSRICIDAAVILLFLAACIACAAHFIG
jgi:choline-glycine betaine transporter